SWALHLHCGFSLASFGRLRASLFKEALLLSFSLQPTGERARASQLLFLPPCVAASAAAAALGFCLVFHSIADLRIKDAKKSEPLTVQAAGRSAAS
uniref:Uncharacterized protein n=1 Tax=Oryza meridionalis TaxID=40149 RepID=A0A0E0DDJ5_9ORYZ